MHMVSIVTQTEKYVVMVAIVNQTEEYVVMEPKVSIVFSLCGTL